MVTSWSFFGFEKKEHKVYIVLQIAEKITADSLCVFNKLGRASVNLTTVDLKINFLLRMKQCPLGVLKNLFTNLVTRRGGMFFVTVSEKESDKDSVKVLGPGVACSNPYSELCQDKSSWLIHFAWWFLGNTNSQP